MDEWKVRQTVYHRLNTNHSDDLNTKDVIMSPDIVPNAIRYFTERDIGWIYPAKSYMVGICYARWVARYFGGDPVDYLNDPDLLYANDPYFQIYKDADAVYDAILLAIGGWEFNEENGMVPDVYGYFVEEFMINE